ncbi:hypothetical protein HI914_02599 [Erysiphe necator]|nr:hypothetical protein HI914_02599 [Erysiphe necator]
MAYTQRKACLLLPLHFTSTRHLLWLQIGPRKISSSQLELSKSKDGNLSGELFFLLAHHHIGKTIYVSQHKS